jgi:phosphoglycerate dehydrogenase-like enzyme
VKCSSTIAHDMQMKEATLLSLVPAAAGLITALEPVTARVLAAAPRLRVVCATGVGYDHIDVEAATARGVTVCISAGSNHQAVAELTLGLMVALARQVAYGDRLLRSGGWERLVGPELWGKTLGIVGLGRVGKSVALLAVLSACGSSLPMWCLTTLLGARTPSTMCRYRSCCAPLTLSRFTVHSHRRRAG